MTPSGIGSRLATISESSAVSTKKVRLWRAGCNPEPHRSTVYRNLKTVSRPATPQSGGVAQPRMMMPPTALESKGCYLLFGLLFGFLLGLFFLPIFTWIFSPRTSLFLWIFIVSGAQPFHALVRALVMRFLAAQPFLVVAQSIIGHDTHCTKRKKLGHTSAGLWKQGRAV